MKWVKPFAIGYEYVCVPDKVNSIGSYRSITLRQMKVIDYILPFIHLIIPRKK